ncbi:MAG: single-stranded DNA-binding protein [Alphaproteobacteria bacterium]|nr:single-stranded DNA-binding protein [Alphaproteobacteria bacterium]
MIRRIEFDGFLGTNPEVKTTSNGHQYTSFRVANRVYGDAENVTYWFSVTVWDAGLQKFCQSLKKGSAVVILGNYTDRTYKSNITGQDEISRDVRAISIDFPSVGRREDDTQTAQTAPAQGNEAPAATNQVSSKPEKVDTKPAAVNEGASVSAAPAEGTDDDLPF